MPKYYEISEVAAKRAKDMNSFSDYKPGSATSAYRQMVDEAYAIAERQKARVDPMYHDKIDALVDRYAKKLAANLNESHVIDGRVPSILIAGGGNFPVRKKEKQNAARDRNMGEYMEIEKLLDKIRSVGTGGISADDDLAVEKLEKKLTGLEKLQATMKSVNAYYRKHKTLEGCPGLSDEDIGRLQSSMANDWRKDPVPYPSFLLTNNNANIRRVRQRIDDLKNRSEFVGWTFPGGEAKFEELLRQLEKAEEYIFLEYFIIDEGLMWGKILEVLARKAAEGVDVRVMYDGTCEFATLPRDYPSRLEKLGIQCQVFSPVQPFVSTHYNYRDHRKILVIDGKVGFTGGVNLADEYINHIEKYGRWKDAAVMLEGEAVRPLTILFLEMWSILREPEFEKFLSVPPHSVPAKGFAAPYGDCPLDGERVGEMVYIDLLNRAKRYIHIMTPYLILDGELETALKFAAERGVDVHLILPHVPDKKFAYALAKTHYKSLLDSGVKISEWLPGFVHAKVFVVDDSEAVVGTINLDYRSLYHHFENAVWMKDTACIPAIEKDFQKTLEFCRDVEPTRESIWEGNMLLHLAGILLKVIAPLL